MVKAIKKEARLELGFQVFNFKEALRYYSMMRLRTTVSDH
jgi:hypothetical protein